MITGIIITVTLVLIVLVGRRWVIDRITAGIITKEKALSPGEPDECGKCGNHKNNRAPTFHSPRYTERSIAMRRPEHLAYPCWECGHLTIRAVKKYDREREEASGV